MEWPVVSVGSLSAGGAGKTPVVIALAELFRERGWWVNVLSRGYGRSGSGVERVEADLDGAAGRFGDEPVLIAQRAAVPVWVGAERFAAGQAAEKDTGAISSASLRSDEPKRVHLLDDGFQHRRLVRAVDVVLITAEDLEDVLLPAGNRREGLRALDRADVVVLREEERGLVEARVRRFMRPGALVCGVRRELRSGDSPEELSAGPRPLAFCGIARPAGFWMMLEQAGCKAVAEVAFADHHAYGAEDMERLLKIAEEQDATGFLTTEKDRVKLPKVLIERLRTIGPVCVAELEAKFTDESAVMRELEARCR